MNGNGCYGACDSCECPSAKEEKTPVINMHAAKQKMDRKRYASSVLDAYDRLDHQSKRDQAEQRSEIERAARDRL